jgi:TonB family protein
MTFHPQLGWISLERAEERIRTRARHGLATHTPEMGLRFRFQSGLPVGVSGCALHEQAKDLWKLSTESGDFFLTRELSPLNPLRANLPESEKDDRLWVWIFAGLLLLIAIGVGILPRGEKTETTEPPILEPVTVTILPEKQKTVTVSAPESLKEIPKDLPNPQAQVRRAVAQNLGFMGLIGKKDLTKALGGAKTALENASPGAGPGGKEGSGGELLVGLGRGVKRTTVGNSGVAGLGGVGTKGAGGGQGGYGNTAVGSGEGRALSAMALSQDMVLEGGLDRSVIQATIAKYLSQVRACYEQGLARNAGLSGQVTVAFEIGAQGNLNSSKVARSSLGDAGVEGCITQRMMSWIFPKPLGGVNVKVSYPFLLKPVK